MMRYEKEHPESLKLHTNVVQTKQDQEEHNDLFHHLLSSTVHRCHLGMYHGRPFPVHTIDFHWL